MRADERSPNVQSLCGASGALPITSLLLRESLRERLRARYQHTTEADTGPWALRSRRASAPLTGLGSSYGTVWTHRQPDREVTERQAGDGDRRNEGQTRRRERQRNRAQYREREREALEAEAEMDRGTEERSGESTITILRRERQQRVVKQMLLDPKRPLVIH